MAEYPQNLLLEGIEVLKSRIPSGHPFLYDQVDTMKYQKWALNCISFLKLDAPDHVEQIKAIYMPDLSLYHQTEKIFGIVQSAVEFIKSKRQPLTRESIEKKSPDTFALDFLHPILVEKCTDHFHSGKYDDCILNAAKVVEVVVRETAGLSNTDLGVNLMRKAFKTDAPILKYSNTPAEQEAVMHLFSGFIGVFKNPHSHRFLEIENPLTVFEILSFANRLLNLVGNICKKESPNPGINAD